MAHFGEVRSILHAAKSFLNHWPRELKPLMEQHVKTRETHQSDVLHYLERFVVDDPRFLWTVYSVEELIESGDMVPFGRFLYETRKGYLYDGYMEGLTIPILEQFVASGHFSKVDGIRISNQELQPELIDLLSEAIQPSGLTQFGLSRVTDHISGPAMDSMLNLIERAKIPSIDFYHLYSNPSISIPNIIYGIDFDHVQNVRFSDCVTKGEQLLPLFEDKAIRSFLSIDMSDNCLMDHDIRAFGQKSSLDSAVRVDFSKNHDLSNAAVEIILRMVCPKIIKCINLEHNELPVESYHLVKRFANEHQCFIYYRGNELPESIDPQDDYLIVNHNYPLDPEPIPLDAYPF